MKVSDTPSWLKQADHFISAVFGIIGGFDANNDGKVSFGEFVQALWIMQQGEEDKQRQFFSKTHLLSDGTSQPNLQM